MDLGHIPAIDQHAHNLLTQEAAARTPFVSAFTEGTDPELVSRHARHTLCYRRSLRDIAELLGCEATEEAVLEKRAGLGLEKLTEKCIHAARLEAVFLDDGFLPGQILPLEWHEQFVPVRRILRLEVLAQTLLGGNEHFKTFREQFRGALELRPARVVSLKSIAAYRTGLDVQPVSPEAAQVSFIAWKHQAGKQPARLTDKTLIDFLLAEALEVAARHGIPLQFHTGFGDPDLDLRLANPLHLRPLLEEKRYRGAPIVLLHASYPFMREAGYLASVYPQVYLDFGLAIPLLSVSGMREAVRMLLELAPFHKVLYSSDAHYIPELFYLASRWGRQVLGEVLEQAVEEGDLTALEAEEVAGRVLRDNARTLYGLEN